MWEGTEDIQVDVDINTEVYPIREKDIIEICLVKQIKPDEHLEEAFSHDPRVLGKYCG